MADKLPVELWEMIIQFLPRRDLATFCKLSRTFNAISTKFLYEHVSIQVTYAALWDANEDPDADRTWVYIVDALIANARRQASAVKSLEIECRLYSRSFHWQYSYDVSRECRTKVDDMLHAALSKMPKLTEFAWVGSVPLDELVMKELARKRITSLTIEKPKQQFDNYGRQLTIRPLIGCPLISLSLDTRCWERIYVPELRELFWELRGTLRHLKVWYSGCHIPENVFKRLSNSGQKLSLISLTFAESSVKFLGELIEAVNLRNLQHLDWEPMDDDEIGPFWSYLRQAPSLNLKTVTTFGSDENLMRFLRSFSGLESLLLGNWARDENVLHKADSFLSNHCRSLRHLSLPYEDNNLNPIWAEPSLLEWVIQKCVHLEELGCSIHEEDMEACFDVLKHARRLKLLWIECSMCAKDFMWEFFEHFRPEETVLLDTLQILAYTSGTYAVRDTHDVRDHHPEWIEAMRTVQQDLIDEYGGISSIAYLMDEVCREIYQDGTAWYIGLTSHGRTPVPISTKEENKKGNWSKWKLGPYLLSSKGCRWVEGYEDMTEEEREEEDE